MIKILVSSDYYLPLNPLVPELNAECDVQVTRI
jgi:hypothetical protein